MQTVTFLNEKGGIGKTTMSMTLATEAARRGLNVVFIDADQQASSTTQFRIRPYPGLWKLVGEEAAWAEVLTAIDGSYYGGENGHLLVLGGDTRTARLHERQVWKERKGSTQYLAQRLEELNGWADLVVIDTAPSISEIHSAVYQASSHILMPTMCARLSLQGVQRSMQHIEGARKILEPHGIRIGQLLGILPTMFYGRELVQYQTLGKLQGKYGDDLVFSEIRRRAAWEQASAMQTPVTVYEPKSDAAVEARRFTDEILTRVM